MNHIKRMEKATETMRDIEKRPSEDVHELEPVTLEAKGDKAAVWPVRSKDRRYGCSK